MAKKRPLIGLTSQFKLGTVANYSRAIAGSSAPAVTSPVAMSMGVAAQSTGNTPPVLPPPTAAAIYTLITQLEDYLMTEAGDNITTELQ